MTWHILPPVQVWRVICKDCSAMLEDTDPERLGREQDAHERGGCA